MMDLNWLLVFSTAAMEHMTFTLHPHYIGLRLMMDLNWLLVFSTAAVEHVTFTGVILILSRFMRPAPYFELGKAYLALLYPMFFR